jgi:hypothetical protein
MGEPNVPDPALVIVGVIHADEGTLQLAGERFRPLVGDLRPVGPQLDFVWSDYYEREMGPDLKRCFLASERLAPRELLADLKTMSNRIERELSREDGRRRINLDPGLLSAENLVLASTKNHGHRIYLRDGIFAEVTLRYHRGEFEALEWTYPDYRTKEVRQLLARVRKEYLKTLRGSPQVLREVMR